MVASAAVVPVSHQEFLVIDDDRLTFDLYAATEADAAYWAHKKCHRMFDGEQPTVPLDSVAIPRDLTAGHHEMSFPTRFHQVPEILVVFNSANRGLERRAAGLGAECLLIARPRLGDVEVVPLDWWDNEPAFFPWSDIERLFRDPVTGRLFGDGSHLRPFVLKEDPRELEAWLR